MLKSLLSRDCGVMLYALTMETPSWPLARFRKKLHVLACEGIWIHHRTGLSLGVYFAGGRYCNILLHEGNNNQSSDQMPLICNKVCFDLLIMLAFSLFLPEPQWKVIQLIRQHFTCWRVCKTVIIHESAAVRNSSDSHTLGRRQGGSPRRVQSFQKSWLRPQLRDF